MYRAASPIYDVPEHPTLRRVKPLPKRRRTSDPAPHDDHDHDHDRHAPAAPPGKQHPEEQDDQVPLPPQQPHTQTQAAAAQMALQAYYMPVLGGVRDLCKPAAPEPDSGAGTETPFSIDLSAAFAGLGTGGTGYGCGYGYGGNGGAGAGGAGQEEEDEGGEGDYVDHLQQPGNTKKRKVPANMSGSAHGHDAGLSGSGAEDDLHDRGVFAGRERDADSVPGGGTSLGGGGGTLGTGAGKKGRLSRATFAGLEHKEALKSRKRQLASVLSTLAHGDTLALDQALSATRLFVQSQVGAEYRIRLSHRRAPRVARALKAYHAHVEDNQGDENKSDRNIVARTEASDRLIATKEEVAILHARFEAELARQAANVAEAAKQAATLSGPVAKRPDRSKQVARTAGGKNADPKGALDQSLLGTKGKGGKKKKRSALANASNPHHLRNYVPSRLPHSGPPTAQQALQNAQNLLTPLPLRFLSADIPPRRRKKSEPAVTPIATLTNPADEWICPFCEYELLYGDEQSYHRAVRSRKKILRRRRRARERAAAAASGVVPAPAVGDVAGTEENAEDLHPGFESSVPAPVLKEGASVGGKQAKWKEGAEGTQAHA